MQTKSFGLIICVSTLLLILGIGVQAQEKKEKDKAKPKEKAKESKEESVALDKVPKAIIDAVKAKFPKAELVSGGTEEGDDGKTVYEISIKDQGTNIDVTLTTDAKIIEVEKEIAADKINKEVKKTLDTEYPKATIKKAEEITKGDTVAFEFLLETADKKVVEVKIDPKGKILETEQKDSADDDDKKAKKDDKKKEEDKKESKKKDK